MSVWGGIGEGIAQGLKERMDREDQERREKMAQANADRQFRFAQGQAERAQANADRAFAAGREDAASAQANADRAFAFRQTNADRAFAASEEQRGIENQRADYDLALKGEAQDWANKINSEKLRQFQIANEKMDAELRKKQERERLSQETAAKQWVFATARMLRGTSGREETWSIGGQNGGAAQTVKGRVIDGDEFYGMFGKDSDLVKQGFYGIAMTNDENGKPMFTLLNKNPQMNVVKDEAAMYDTYKGEYDEDLANEYFKGAADKRDLGLFSARAKATADAQVSAREASDPYGRKRQIDAAVAVLKADDASASDREAALRYLGSVFGGGASGGDNGGNGGEWAGFSAEKRAALEAEGYVWDAANRKPVKRQRSPKARIVAP